MKQKVLSCGWIAYNEKTVAIESKVVNPACMHIIDGELPKLRDQLNREAASQALVDESYHILLIVSACSINRRERDLLDLWVPQFELINQMWACQDENPERWKRILIQLSCSIVSEVLVSDYLRQLSTAQEVQPLNVMATEIHRRDESVHNALFKNIGASIYSTLSPRERDFFLSVLPKPIQWFANAELEVWRTMLQQIGFPKADEMINDCLLDQEQREVNLDLTTLAELYVDLEIERDFVI
jgi:P-aminobenzoate N-oxygenase AurF